MSSTKLKRVALIGRPNVGKSTLFNVLTRTRRALVRDEPGVTRDLQTGIADWWGEQFEVVDTGGITESKDGFSKVIRERVLSALHSFDVIVAIFDAQIGLVPEDRDILRIVASSGKPYVLVVNKVDRPVDIEFPMSEFYEFGHDLICASFESVRGVDEVVEWIRAQKVEAPTQVEESDRLKVTIIGKPNVGKSSLCNFLVGEDRMLVSETAGSTVDAVEVDIEMGGEMYTLVDTAGLRRASKRREGVEYLSAHMSMEAVRRSDVVILVIDVHEGPTVQDVKMVEACLDAHKPVVLAGNKLDTCDDKAGARQLFADKVAQSFRFFPDIKYTFLSAKTGAGVRELFRIVDRLGECLDRKIPTSKLNRFFFNVIRKAPAPVWGSVNVKFYYLVQTGQRPPSFIAFANHPQGVTPGYRRFVAKHLREEFDLLGVPVRIFVMPAHRDLSDESGREMSR